MYILTNFIKTQGYIKKKRNLWHVLTYKSLMSCDDVGRILRNSITTILLFDMDTVITVAGNFSCSVAGLNSVLPLFTQYCKQLRNCCVYSSVARKRTSEWTQHIILASATECRCRTILLSNKHFWSLN